jgi:hypothetical protein
MPKVDKFGLGAKPTTIGSSSQSDPPILGQASQPDPMQLGQARKRDPTAQQDPIALGPDGCGHRLIAGALPFMFLVKKCYGVWLAKIQ